MPATSLNAIIAAARQGHRPSREDALGLADCQDLPALAAAAEALTLEGFGRIVTYSRKVFIPLTQLCRDVCHYCTFAQAPRELASPYLSPEEVLAIARAGATAGCKEALFTLGDKPELRYGAARRALDEMGYASTLDYLEAMARLVYEETGLLPHLNPGIMNAEEMARLRKVSFSMGIMLESASPRLCEKGMPHHGSPDKDPAVRLACLRTAGELAVPFTSGILIGIGETRAERIESLLALRDLNDEFGHIQEVIIQNFRAKPDTKMADAPEPSLDEHLWTLAVARLIFGSAMSLQAPPNLQRDGLAALVGAGVNDWGGVSPVTPDHVNPEAPWPHLVELAAETTAAGRHLAERLALAPAHAMQAARWVDAALVPALLARIDIFGRARTDSWHAGAGHPMPVHAAAWVDATRPLSVHPEIAAIIDKARAGADLSEAEIVALFATEGDDFRGVLRAADQLRVEVVGDGVSFVVNRNINYTNICTYRCNFCAFAKGRATPELRGPAYRLDPAQVADIAEEAWNKGATEVCMQGGIHPEYTGHTYREIIEAVKARVPGMHLHAFSPLEIHQGASTLGMNLHDYLRMLKEAGLSTLPGTAAEILDDEVRAIICHDKINTQEWLEVVRAAHEVGIKTTATIMYGHVDRAEHWARHLLHVRNLQKITGGFTEFVPLAFVHMEAPMGRRGKSRAGPTLKESLLMHAVARLALHPLIPNIQTSWVKMGGQGATLCLQAGANDLGGVLMYESITRSAGGTHGQEFSAQALEKLARSIGRRPWRRTTLYQAVTEPKSRAA
ncbi:FO synthase [Denitratisoma oestradiolicum]|uniref:FO synthase n=3 Tax=Denitratisoma oestradiolicum TaxID=311182 RepID=A0A6S6Y0P0_9PROT|nr:5-amino-6-(D-ribitylamino)uracil--L-tyrosine 4-hydroxyphenyl transferase CofH [Denitratisoma oestradiolicum]CAB1370863.1 FO synthase [Denitratisoma oestradiolicum]